MVVQENKHFEGKDSEDCQEFLSIYYLSNFGDAHTLTIYLANPEGCLK